MFTEQQDREKRMRGTRASHRHPNRPVPFDFAEGVEKCDRRVNKLMTHYSAAERTIRRWARVSGITLRTHKESLAASRPPREFDPALDGDLLRQAISAMTGRA